MKQEIIKWQRQVQSYGVAAMLGAIVVGKPQGRGELQMWSH